MIGVNPNASIEDIIELNDMYVDSIKAKLEILNDYNQDGGARNDQDPGQPVE